jgi:hypothetical protein
MSYKEIMKCITIIIVTTLLIILAYTATTQQVQAAKVKLPCDGGARNDTKYCLGYQDAITLRVQNVTTSCGEGNNLECIAPCNTGNLSKYCLGFNEGMKVLFR